MRQGHRVVVDGYTKGNPEPSKRIRQLEVVSVPGTILNKPGSSGMDEHFETQMITEEGRRISGTAGRRAITAESLQALPNANEVDIENHKIERNFFYKECGSMHSACNDVTRHALIYGFPPSPIDIEGEEGIAALHQNSDAKPQCLNCSWTFSTSEALSDEYIDDLTERARNDELLPIEIDFLTGNRIRGSRLNEAIAQIEAVLVGEEMMGGSL